MDSFDFDNVKAEKANAMRRFNRLQSIAQLFRILELFLALIFLSWFFNRLPFAVKISGDFFRQLGGIIASPLFVFVLSNGIIATLIAKSGIFSSSGENLGVNNAEGELYEEIIKNSGDRTKSLSEDPPVYQDKQIISEINTSTTARTCEADDVEEMDFNFDNPRVYRRSKSEKIERRRRRESGEKVLRRSETEKCEKFGVELYEDEEIMSNEEFQRTIEEFIAKQLRFRRQESMSIVVKN